jgi:hypothetical protein
VNKVIDLQISQNATNFLTNLGNINFQTRFRCMWIVYTSQNTAFYIRCVVYRGCLISPHCLQFFFCGAKYNLDISFGGMVSLSPTQITLKVSVIWLVCIHMFSMFFEVT